MNAIFAKLVETRLHPFAQRLAPYMPRELLLRRYQSSANPLPSKPASRSGVDRVNAHLPRFLQRYTLPLRNAPVTHISAFLVLHELTAVVPLLGLAGLFHYTDWLPPVISEGKWVSDGVEKFGRYFKRKGWISEDSDVRGKGGVNFVVEFATAYAITKALLPIRLIFSVWATPWFARVVVVPCISLSRRIFGGKPR